MKLALPPVPASRPRLRAPAIVDDTRVVRLCACALAAAVAATYARSVVSPRTIAGNVRAGGEPLGSLAPPALEAALDRVERRFAFEPLALTVAGERHAYRRGDAGIALDREALATRVRALGKTGWPIVDLEARAAARSGAGPGIDLPLPSRLDPARALAFMEQVKSDLDRPAQNARLDLEHRAVQPEESGLLIDVYGSLAALSEAVRNARYEVPLNAAVAEPAVRRDALAGLDISTVLGRFETGWSLAPKDADRAWNLKRAADKLDGFVLTPGATLSFNAVVGDRTEKEGYRTAPVISAGELVDGLAGGACQISSTLHAAAFFAGLDILSSHPHSRPSAYIVMGLDATVVYPTTDLVLRNPYDFPVVIHYSVALGKARVEILGKRRPYRVAFERETVSDSAYRTVRRYDDDVPKGQTVVDQHGLRGFSLKRRRILLEGKKEVRTEEWNVSYPATTEYLRIGTGPPPPKPKGKKKVKFEKLIDSHPLTKLLANPSPQLRIEQ